MATTVIRAGRPVRLHKPALRRIDRYGDQARDVVSWRPTQVPPLRRRAANRRRNRAARTSRKGNR